MVALSSLLQGLVEGVRHRAHLSLDRVSGRRTSVAALLRVPDGVLDRVEDSEVSDLDKLLCGGEVETHGDNLNLRASGTAARGGVCGVGRMRRTLTPAWAPEESPAFADAMVDALMEVSLPLSSFVAASERYAPLMKSLKAFFSSRISAAGAFERRAMREP